jgi:hypothetical protein
MDFSRNDFLSVDNVRASIVSFCIDSEMKKISEGKYNSFIQRGLQELSFDTFFNKKRFDLVVPNDLHIPLPPNTFSVDQVYAYNGTECDISNAATVYHKQNYYTRGNGFFAKNRGINHNDPFYNSGSGSGLLQIDPNNSSTIIREPSIADGLLYYNVENGMLMISSAVRANYEKLHVVAYGSTCPLGEIPLIPPLFQEAIEDYACESACRQLIGEEPNTYVGLWKIYSGRLDYRGFNGSWYKAKQRVRSMSTGERNDFNEYLSRWSWA